MSTSYRDSQRYKKTYSYFRSTPRPELMAADITSEQLLSLDWKPSVVCASTVNITILSTVSVIDGVSLTDTNRVLIKNQTVDSENGIYDYNALTSLLTRSSDALLGTTLSLGAVCYVEDGTQAGSAWLLNDISPVTWSIFKGGPAGSNTYVQFNDNGILGGDSGLTYNKSTDSLAVTGDLAVNGRYFTTTSSSFNLINTNATTINFAGEATVALNVGNSSATNTFLGKTKFSQGLSGSLTRLTDGSSYLIAGNNITITSASNGAVTFESSGGGMPAGMPLVWEIPLFAGIMTNSSSAMLRLSSRKIDLSSFTSTYNGLSLNVNLHATIETTLGTATIELYDINSVPVLVTNSNITTVSSIATNVESANLGVANANGSIFISPVHMYELDLSVSGGGIATCSAAWITLKYS